MLTRCPACQTVFRVSTEQLAARAGRVRCGHCLIAFNARQNPVAEAPGDEPAAPAAEQSQPATSAATPPPPGIEPSPPAEAADFCLEVVEDAPQPDAPAPEPAALPAVLHTRFNPIPLISTPSLRAEWDAAPEPAGAPETEAEATEVAADAAPTPQAVAAPLVAPDGGGEAAEPPALAPTPLPVAPGAVPPPTPAAAGQRRLGFAAGALTALLLAQSVFLFRQDLTQAVPALRPALAAWCDSLGCDLPLPRKAQLINVEASDLHPEPGQGGHFLLQATLFNRAGFPQAYPHVELSLTDAADQPLMRRVFAPEEWLRDAARSAAGLPAGGRAEVVLPFSAAGVPALGYRVYAFYP